MEERIIYDEEFEKEFKNINNAKIMNKVCGFYKNIIPKEDLHRCKLVALWKALVKFDASCGQKFTSYLYNSIKWECQKELYIINKYRRGLAYDDNLFECFDKNSIEMIDAMEMLSPKIREAIEQRFFYGLTMEEIGKKNSYSRETARRYVKRGLEKLRDICEFN